MNAFSEDVGTPAAYGIASQTHHVFSNSTAVVGSIGTFAVKPWAWSPSLSQYEMAREEAGEARDRDQQSQIAREGRSTALAEGCRNWVVLIGQREELGVPADRFGALSGKSRTRSYRVLSCFALIFFGSRCHHRTANNKGMTPRPIAPYIHGPDCGCCGLM